MPTFTPPTFPMPVAREGLWRFYTYPVGFTVLKNDGVYTQTKAPLQEQIESADVAYIGGHTYTVSSDEAAALTAAGYGAQIT